MYLNCFKVVTSYGIRNSCYFNTVMLSQMDNCENPALCDFFFEIHKVGNSGREKNRF